MSRRKKKTWQQKMGIILSVIGVIAMLMFTLLPFFSGQGGY